MTRGHVVLMMCFAVLFILSCTTQFGGMDDDVASDDDADDDTDDGCIETLIPSPCQDGYDEELEKLARMYDRQFHVFNAYGHGINSDIIVSLDEPDDRALIEDFLRETDGWDFEAYSGEHQFDVVTSWEPVAGLYAGVGIAADAFRYGVLRDQGYDEDEVETAREHLLDAIEGLHIATAITGTPGVIARGYLRKDIPSAGDQIETTPLFDEEGNPLPPEKDNGTWRDDNSGGDYPNYIWIDSCSRDQFIGWMAAFAAVWEVIKDDPEFSDELKQRLRDDAKQIGRSLMVVRKSGFDLEIFDADGRTTYHGYINENSFDRIYLPFLPFKNGMHSVMALGSVAALYYVSGDEQLGSYLYDTLIAQRGLHLIAKSNQVGVDFWVQTNYSNVNMAFMGFWLAMRYIDDEDVLADLRAGLKRSLYDKPHRTRQPVEQAQSLYDFVYCAGTAGADAWSPMRMEPDGAALARGLQTLKEFPTPPYWDIERVNCDEQEIESGVCYGEDGTRLDLLGYVGRGGKLVSAQPVPMRIRPSSNYHWRSNPYEVNGGGNGSRMIPGVDFRFAYWLGRWVKRASEIEK